MTIVPTVISVLCLCVGQMNHVGCQVLTTGVLVRLQELKEIVVNQSELLGKQEKLIQDQEMTIINLNTSIQEQIQILVGMATARAKDLGLFPYKGAHCKGIF